MATDRTLFFKGIKFLSIALPLLFLGPVIIHSSFKNQNHSFFYVVISLGILICLVGMFMIFRGVSTMVKALFKDNS